MERNFKRISDELKLPQESRERIRAQLLSCQKKQEEIPMKKRKPKVHLLIAAVVILALTLTGAAAVTQLFRNDILISSRDEVSTETGAAGFRAPAGTLPDTLEEISRSDRFKSEDWTKGEQINGSVIPEYHHWDSAEVLSSDPSLRVRRVSRSDGAEKMEYTAEDPSSLLSVLTGRVQFDLSWMGRQYRYVPNANLSFVITDEKGAYVCELFQALYAKADGSGYVRLEVSNTAEADYFMQSYIVDGSYKTAYYYTTDDGFEFLVTMHNGHIWASCDMSHASISLYGAYLTKTEVEDILDHLSLSVDE